MGSPRITIGHVRGLVALVAFASFGGVMWQRSVEFAARSEEYADQAEMDYFSEKMPAGPVDSASLPTPGKFYDGEPVRLGFRTRRALIQKRLAVKYRCAARFPWLPVAPDPILPPL